VAKLPTREDLGPLPSALTGRPIARLDIKVPDTSIAARGRLAAARGLQDLGQGFAQVAAAFEKQQEEDDALDAIKAKAYRDTEYLKLERSFDNDPEFETYGERHTKRAQEIDSEALNMIKNKQLRERWGYEFQVGQAISANKILEKAYQLERDRRRADLINALDTHRSMYIDPQASLEDKAQARRSMELAIAASARAGLITPENALSLNERYVKGVAAEDAKVELLSDPDALDRELKGVTPFQRRLELRESGGDPTRVNPQGYAGSYQFGAPRLLDLGFYRLGDTERIDKGKWSGDKWSGSFDIPGFPELRTLEDFLANPEAQKAVFDAHVRLMDKEIAANRLDAYEGLTVGGVKITREGLYGMLHLGGIKSTMRALQSGGADNPADANGTTVLDYAAMGEPYSRYASLDPLERAQLRSDVDRALKQDPDLDLLRKEIAKTGYDMLMDDKMDAGWLEANRDILTVSDYKAFLRGLQPGGTSRKMEPSEYLRLFDLADNDPQTAMDELRDMYGRDEIAKDDFKSLFSRANQNIKSTRGRPYSTEIRQYVRQQLAPSDRDPDWWRSRQLDAQFQFDDWLEANPTATREEIRKQAQVIIDDFRAIRYGRGVTELPPPRFVAKPREAIEDADLEISKAKVVEELKAGKLTAKEAAEQAAILRRWFDLLKYRKAK
jgi:hypothetical protein